MQIQTLKAVSLQILANTFTAAFADYFVKIEMTVPALQFKMRQEQIDLNLSAGVFDQGQLVGFILNGIGVVDGRKEAYNGGTGVLPAYRGNRLTQKMYQFLMPLFKSAGITACRLEVIDRNKSAIKVYEAIGFKIVRDFDCQKGVVNPNFELPDTQIYPLTNPPWSILPGFWNAAPSWSFSIEANKRIQGELKMLGAYDENQLVGYAFFLSKIGRVTQFGVHPDYRRRKIGKLLFAKLGQVGNPKMTIINIDKTDKGTLSFLQKIGFSSYIGQFEMTMTLFYGT